MTTRALGAIIALTLVSVQLACSPTPVEEAPPKAEGLVVDVTDGPLEGTVSDHDPAVRVFRGIPYAAPPLGELRWRPPQPVSSWEDPRPAVDFSPACMQLNREPDSFYGPGPSEMSENCLYLNVWTAALPSDTRPVMVWLHGGGLVNGTGSDPRFEGTALARRGVVLVTINYRLGPFGFLAHPLLSAEDEHDSSGNYGVLDQIAALQWVQDNISSFGGDPGRVTIFGQSAGAWSVDYLMVSPLSSGLFHRAIAQSGGRSSGTSRLREPSLEGDPAEKVGETFVTGLLTSATERIAAMGEGLPLTLESMRSFSAKEILDLFSGYGSSFRSTANVDGRVLAESVYDAFAGGRQHDVPLISGWTADEGTTLAPGTAPTDRAAYAKWRKETFGDMADEHADLYPAESDHRVGKGFYQSHADSRFGWPVWTAASLMKTVSSPAYLYYFTRVPPGEDSDTLGAYHSVDVAYVFTNFDLSPDPVARREYDDIDRALGDLMASYWVRFAETGDPNGDGLPMWPVFDQESPEAMVFGDEPTVQSGVRQPQLEFFDRIQSRLAGSR